MIGVASLNMISSFSDGFSMEVQRKLSTIDGHLRIQKYSQFSDYSISAEELAVLMDTLSFHPEIKTTIPFIEKRGMIRKGKSTEGIIVYGVPESALSEVFQLEHFLTQGNLDFNGEKQIILGEGLADLLQIKLGDKAVVFDLEKSLTENILSAGSFVVSGIMKTGFSEYDKLLAFLPLEDAAELFDFSGEYSGVITMVYHPEDIDRLDQEIIGYIGSYPYITSSWKERHGSLFQWLSVYDLPIKLVMIFITLVAIFNISSTLWMIISEKTRDIGVLQTMGFSSKQVRRIFLLEGFLIGLSGAVLGIVLSSGLLFLQMQYAFISLSSSVYFLDYLPVAWSLENIFLYPVLALIFAVAAAYIPCIRIRRINPAQAVRYE